MGYAAILLVHFFLYFLAMMFIPNFISFKKHFYAISVIYYSFFFVFLVVKDRAKLISRYVLLRNNFPLRNLPVFFVVSVSSLFLWYLFYETSVWSLNGNFGDMLYLAVAVSGVTFVSSGTLVFLLFILIFHKEIDGG